MADTTHHPTDGGTAKSPDSSQNGVTLEAFSFTSAIVGTARVALSERVVRHRPKVCWQGIEDSHVPTKDRLIISIAIGQKAQELLSRTGPSMERYAKKCGAQFTVLTEGTQAWWGLEKFRVASFARKHHQTLFLDADVFVRSSAPNLFDLIPPKQVAASLELEELEIMDLRNSATEWARHMNDFQGEPAREFRGLNSGVVLCDSATAHVWSPPTKEFVPFHTSEQAWVERNVDAFKLSLHPLHWKFNCQHWWADFDTRVAQGEFVHLSGASHEKRLILCDKLIAGKI